MNTLMTAYYSLWKGIYLEGVTSSDSVTYTLFPADYDTWADEKVPANCPN